VAQTSNLNTGSSIPTTNIWDSAAIEESEIKDDNLKLLFVNLYQNLNRMSLSIVSKDNGIYDTQALLSEQTFFPLPGAALTG